MIMLKIKEKLTYWCKKHGYITMLTHENETIGGKAISTEVYTRSNLRSTMGESFLGQNIYGRKLQIKETQR